MPSPGGGNSNKQQQRCVGYRARGVNLIISVNRTFSLWPVNDNGCTVDRVTQQQPVFSPSSSYHGITCRCPTFTLLCVSPPSQPNGGRRQFFLGLSILRPFEGLGPIRR